MSTTIDPERAISPSPQSPKKRKVAATSPETSKKRRKRDQLDTTTTEADQELSITKKERRRRKHKDSDVEVIQSPQHAPDSGDVALPDAPEDESSPPAEALTNGTSADIDIPASGLVEEIDNTQLESQQPSCFYEKRLSIQVPIPAISLSSSTSSLLSLHLAPLLLTYFPPADGIILSFSNPVLSATPSHGVNLPLVPPKKDELSRNPPDETFARCGDGYGVCWVWLTATFLVFKPESGDELKGWTNVTSEGFVGLVSYNYFQTAVGKSRIPKAWIWNGPMGNASPSKKKARRGKLRGENGVSASQEEIDDGSQYADQTSNGAEADSGSFLFQDGGQVPATQTFRVVDTEMVPGHERDRWTLQIEGSLLSPEEEIAVAAEEKKAFEQVRRHGRNRSGTVDSESDGVPLMSGALSFSQAASPQ